MEVARHGMSQQRGIYKRCSPPFEPNHRSEASLTGRQAMKNRLSPLVLGLLSYFVISVFPTSEGGAAEVNKVIVSGDAPALADLPFDIALDKHFYNKEGLEVLRVLFRSGPTAIQALVSGSTQFSTAFGAGTRAAMSGAPVKGILAFNDKPTFSLYARRDAGIRSGTDLKGKKIAVTGVGSSTDFAARMILKHYRLDPDNDAFIVAVGSQNVFPALTSGSVDAAIVWPPTFAMAEKLGMIKIQYLGDILELPGSGVITSDRLLKENPILIKRFLRATIRGFRYVRDPNNKEEIVTYMMRAFKLDRDVAELNFKFVLDILSQKGFLSKKAIDNFIGIARDRVKTLESNDTLIDKMYSFQLLEDVLREQ
jgi:NitT/TauT family transport system substrate-binding protein